MESAQVITNSSAKCYQRCPRLYEYKYVHNKVPATLAEPLIVGIAVHAGLEYYWTGIKMHIMVKPAGMNAAAWDAAEELGVKLSRDEQMRIKAYLRGYHRKYWAIDGTYNVKSVEETFSIPYRGLNISGKFDVVLEKDGRIYVMDHKTVGRKDYFNDFNFMNYQSIDSQFLTYAWAAQEIYNNRNVTFIYDGIAKTNSKPKKSRVRQKKTETTYQFNQRKEADSESEAAYTSRISTMYKDEIYERYMRKEIPMLRNDIREHIDNMVFTGNLMCGKSINDEFDYVYPKNTGSCRMYNRPCDYLGVCAGVETLDDAKFKTKERTHPELVILEQ